LHDWRPAGRLGGYTDDESSEVKFLFKTIAPAYNVVKIDFWQWLVEVVGPDHFRIKIKESLCYYIILFLSHV